MSKQVSNEESKEEKHESKVDKHESKEDSKEESKEESKESSSPGAHKELLGQLTHASPARPLGVDHEDHDGQPGQELIRQAHEPE